MSHFFPHTQTEVKSIRAWRMCKCVNYFQESFRNSQMNSRKKYFVIIHPFLVPIVLFWWWALQLNGLITILINLWHNNGVSWPSIIFTCEQQGPNQITVCSSCKYMKNRHFPPILAMISEEISAVPMKHWKHLSPIHMSCSLGQASESNRYTNYRHLQGFIGLSKNKHALNLHSGLIGAFLDQNKPPH